MDRSELGVSGLLPTGMATLLLADVEGSTRLWETQPDEMTAALARLNQTVSEVGSVIGHAVPVSVRSNLARRMGDEGRRLVRTGHLRRCYKPG